MNTGGNNAPLIAAGGGAVLFISLFMNWFGSLSAWQLFDIVDLLLAVLALIALGVGVMLATGNMAVNLPSSPASIVTTTGIVSLSIVAAFILEAESRDFGIFLALIATIAIVVGGMGLRGAGPGATTRSSGERRDPAPPPSSGGPGGPGAPAA